MPVEVLRTTAGEFPLQELRVALDGHEWSILHTDALLTHADEAEFILEKMDRLPYGVALWPAAIALAHEVGSRADAFRGTRVLELGAGIGLPGIVAASLGARVVQTDHQEVAMSLCRRNGERNGVTAVEHRVVDWTAWDDTARYDWILGSDILYGEPLHPHLRRIFEANLKPGGRILLSDPFRAVSLPLLETLEADGWRIAMTKWGIGEGTDLRPVGVFDLAPPMAGGPPA